MRLQSRRYIETRDFHRDALIGIGVTIVDRNTGAVYAFGSGTWPWDAILGFLCVTGRTSEYPIERYRSVWRRMPRPPRPADLEDDDCVGRPTRSVAEARSGPGTRVGAMLARGRGVGVGALTWALAWAAAWTLPAVLVDVPQWIAVGFLAGADFSLGMALGRRHEDIDTFSLGRAAVRGSVGSAFAALLVGPPVLMLSDDGHRLLPLIALTAVLGAASGVATVMIGTPAVRSEEL